MIRLYLLGGVAAAFAASAGFGYIQTQRLHRAQDALAAAKAYTTTTKAICDALSDPRPWLDRLRPGQ